MNNMETGIEHRVEPPSAKPPRWNIKKPALEVLEKAFERDHFPSLWVRHRISEELGVSSRQVAPSPAPPSPAPAPSLDTLAQAPG